MSAEPVALRPFLRDALTGRGLGLYSTSSSFRARVDTLDLMIPAMLEGFAADAVEVDARMERMQRIVARAGLTHIESDVLL